MTIYLNEMTKPQATQKLERFILGSKCKELTVNPRVAQLIVEAEKFESTKESQGHGNWKIGKLGNVEIRLDSNQSMVDGRIFERGVLVANVIETVDI